MNQPTIKSMPAWLAELAILIIIGLTPIFFNYFYPSNIDLNKLVIFKIFTLFLLFATVWRLSKYELSWVKNSWLKYLPFIGLFVFLILSLFFSVDIVSSWFGSYDRHEV